MTVINCIFWVSLLVGSVTALENTIVRPNFGVAMHRVSSANLASSYWTHTFIIPFLTLPSAPWDLGIPCDQLYSDKSLKICADIKATVSEFVKDSRMAIDRIHLNVATVKQLIPAKMDGRHKRALFGFVGSIMKSLYGVATEDDVEDMRKHIDAYHKLTVTTINEVNRLGKSLGSFMNVTDHRISAAVKGMENNHKAILALVGTVETTKLKLGDLDTSIKIVLMLTKNIANTLLAIQQLESVSQSWIVGIQSLLQGFLPVQMAPLSPHWQPIFPITPWHIRP
jgi:hypothetical protein